MKDNQTIAQFLKVKIFPFIVKDDKGKHEIYHERSNGYWYKREYNAKGNQIYFEDADGYWIKHEYNAKGNLIYYESSTGFWIKYEYDDEGNVIYLENSDGFILDKRPKPMIELTLEDIAKLKGVDVSQIRIKE